MIEQTYILDMIPGESTPPVVHVSQFDVNSRTLTFNLMKGGVAFVPDTGMSVTLDGMKPDNTIFSYPMTVDGSSVSIDVLTQMTVVSGHVRCEVSVSNQTGKIGSANFILAVEESPIDSGSISESDIPIFEDLKNQAQQAAADAEQSASDAESAASSVSAILPESAGTAGQVLTKTPTGADWKTPTGGQWGGITGNLADQTDLNNALTELNSNLNTKVSSVNEVLPDTNGNVSLIAEDIPADGVGSKDVSGNPIIITDGVAENAQNLSVEIEPIQDFNGYDKPWAGGAGKNLLEITSKTETKKGITFTVNGDGSVTVNGTTTESNCFINLNYVAGQFSVPINVPINIGLYGKNRPSALKIQVIGNSGVDSVSYAGTAEFGISEDRTVTTTSATTTTWARLQIQEAGVTIDNVTVYPFVCYSDNKMTAYEPYSNICPVSGRTSVNVTRTGKNKAPMMKSATSRGITVTVDDDGVVTANGTNTAGLAGTIGQSEYVTLKAGSYILSGSTTANTGVTLQVIKNVDGTITSLARDNTGEGKEFTLEEDTLVTMRGYISANANVSNLKLYPMIRLASEADATYEPYQSQSVTVQLGQTVYGGTLNVTTGELTVETANIASYNGESIGEPWWSSMDEYVPGTTPTTGAQVVYTLATPTTVSLTPAQLALLEGYNIITTDGDNLNLRYTGTVASNVQTEIDEFEESTRKVAGSLAMIETSPATANHAVGDYLMLNNKLCKVTSAIATGEQIIVGSNVQYTTVAEELAAILAQIAEQI